MWINPQYLPDDPLAVAKEIVERHPLAVIIAEDPLRIAHMPVLWRLDADGGPVLVGHAPLEDPISRALADGSRITVVFPGPASYVTPHWYGSEGLPTYNYAPVHVGGRATRLSEDELRAHLHDLVGDHERHHSPEDRPWTFDATAHERLERLLPRILGFTIPVSELQVKTKLGQNRPQTDNETVESHLAAGEGPQREVAELMRRHVLGRER